MKYFICLIALSLVGTDMLFAQNKPPATQAAPGTPRPTPEETEIWEPLPKPVTPGKTFSTAPSDAIVLFDGKNLNQWVASDKSPAKWIVADGIVTVNKSSGNIITKQSFKNFQLHIEWRVPSTITGTSQSRGNSGVFLASTGGGDRGYEVQILDGYNNENKTYVNGMVGSVYKQYIPLSNPAKKAGEWNVYDIAWTAPLFNEDGTLKSAAKVTVFLNGVIIQNNVELQGETVYIGKPFYKQYDKAPIKLQSHGDPSEPISFRNIWVREL